MWNNRPRVVSNKSFILGASYASVSTMFAFFMLSTFTTAHPVPFSVCSLFALRSLSICSELSYRSLTVRSPFLWERRTFQGLNVYFIFIMRKCLIDFPYFSRLSHLKGLRQKHKLEKKYFYEFFLFCLVYVNKNQNVLTFGIIDGSKNVFWTCPILYLYASSWVYMCTICIEICTVFYNNPSK